VCVGVGRVPELTELDRTRRLEFVGASAGVGHFAVDQFEVGPVGGHDLPAFLRLVRRHDDRQVVAAGGSDEREADTGVAAGRFDERVAGFDQAVALGRPDHLAGRPVLGRAAGVERFDLRGDRHALRRIDLDERRADGVQDTPFH